MQIPENYFMYIDLAVFVILLFTIIRGGFNGALYELINLLFLAFSIVGSYFLSPLLAKKFPIFNYSSGNQLINQLVESLNINFIINKTLWLVLATVVLNFVFLLLKPLFKHISNMPFLGKINRAIGGILGLIKGVIICLLLSIVVSLPIFVNGMDAKKATVLKYGETITKNASDLIFDNIDIEKALESLDSEDIDDAREEFEEWLIDQGLLDE